MKRAVILIDQFSGFIAARLIKNLNAVNVKNAFEYILKNNAFFSKIKIHSLFINNIDIILKIS